MNKGALAGLAAVPVVGLVALLMIVVLVGGPAAAACGDGDSATVELGALPDITDAGLSKDASVRAQQITNAALIMNAAAAKGMPAKAQPIGVMTAMGESTLINVDYGDDRHGVTNPDGSLTCSLGLFQQQWCLGWGTKEQVMDPTYAATAFFNALEKVDGWQDLAPTIAAHRTQRNADPNHYAKHWDNAQRIVAALAPTAHLAGPDATGAGTCGAGGPGVVNDQGWSQPAAGPMTSGFGMRVHPVTGRRTLHTGIDLAPGCSEPIWAANGGRVVRAGPFGTTGNAIDIDHGSGVLTRYGHMYTPDLLVAVGDQVKAGQLIARVGSAGRSTGCHLHFELHVNGTEVDPAAYLKDRGITW